MKTTQILTLLLLCVVMIFGCQNINTKTDFIKYTINNYDSNKSETKPNKTLDVNKKTNENIDIKNFPQKPKTYFELILEVLTDDLVIAVNLTYLALVATFILTIIYHHEDIDWIFENFNT